MCSPLLSPYSSPNTPTLCLTALHTVLMFSSLIQRLYRGAVCKPFSFLYFPPHTPSLCHTTSHTVLMYSSFIQLLYRGTVYRSCMLAPSPLSIPLLTLPLSVIQPYIQFLCTSNLYSCCIEELYKGAVCKPLSSLYYPSDTPNLCHTALHTVVMYSSFIQLLYRETV